MANRPKDKGTWAETQVALYLRDHGWPYAERRALAGVTDKGDITGTPALAWEVKYANGGIRMGPWIAETYVERENCRADHGILVIKPRGIGAAATAKWPAVMLSWDYDALAARAHMATFSSEVVEYQSASLVKDLVAANKDRRATVLTRRPPGTKETPDQWYRVMHLEDMVLLLRSAGYGTPIPLEDGDEAHNLRGQE